MTTAAKKTAKKKTTKKRTSRKKPDLSYINEKRRPLAIPISKLAFDKRNARKHNARSLKAVVTSLKKHGQAKPIVVWARSAAEWIVMAGNGTLGAALELGWTHIAANVREFETESEARDYARDDNRTAELSEWDEMELPKQIEEARAEGREINGWEDVEIEDFAKPKVVDKPGKGKGRRPRVDAIAKQARVTKIERGMVVQLGRHFLMCGDSFSEADLDALFGKAGVEHVDAVVTDPPFAIYGSSSGIGKSIADNKMVLPFFRNLARSIMGRVKLWGHVYTHCDWRSWSSIDVTYAEIGLDLKNMIVWDKGGGGLGSMYANGHELIAFHAKLSAEPAMVSTMTKGQRTVYQPNISRKGRVKGSDRLHNAAKPVELERWLIENSTDKDEVVLDLFGGSGTTLIAAEESGRTCLMMELDPNNATIIIERWNRYAESEGRSEEVVDPLGDEGDDEGGDDSAAAE